MKKLSELGEIDFVKAVRELYKHSADMTEKMRRETMESRLYVEGDQWDESDLAQRENRPSVTYNRTGPFVDAVVGMHVQNRQEATYLPRTVQDADSAKAETLQYASDWARDISEADDEETDMFIDLVTGGLGATETKLTFDMSPDGHVFEERIDWVRELFWDPNAKKRNLTDKRWVLRIKPWDKDEIKDEWPDAELTGGEWDTREFFSQAPHRADEAWLYKNDQLQDLPRNTQTVVMFEWFEMVKKHRVLFQGQQIDISVGKFKALKPVFDTQGIPYTTKPLPRRQYYRAFISGDNLLEKGEAPIDGFSIDITTGKRSEKTGGFYGLVRSLKDPQKWANVFFSSILYQLATNGKGIMAEKGAFDNLHKAREQWSDPDAIVETTPGALRDGKILPKPEAPYPQGLDRLMEHSIAAFNDVTGIPVELLGLTKADQAGIVEAQRRQSGVAILSWAFDAMRKFRREQAKTLSKYLLVYMTDGRLIRVTGEKRYVPFVRQEGTLEYDIIVDDAPTSPNQKDKVWAIMQSLMPYMVKMGMPVPQDVFDYLPIPEALKESWKKQMEPNPEKQQMEQQHHQIQMRGMVASVEKDEAKAQLDKAKAQETMALIGPEHDKRITEARKNAADTGIKMAGG